MHAQSLGAFFIFFWQYWAQFCARTTTNAQSWEILIIVQVRSQDGPLHLVHKEDLCVRVRPTRSRPWTGPDLPTENPGPFFISYRKSLFYLLNEYLSYFFKKTINIYIIWFDFSSEASVSGEFMALFSRLSCHIKWNKIWIKHLLLMESFILRFHRYLISRLIESW